MERRAKISLALIVLRIAYLTKFFYNHAPCDKMSLVVNIDIVWRERQIFGWF